MPHKIIFLGPLHEKYLHLHLQNSYKAGDYLDLQYLNLFQVMKFYNFENCDPYGLKNGKNEKCDFLKFYANPIMGHSCFLS